MAVAFGHSRTGICSPPIPGSESLRPYRRTACTELSDRGIGYLTQPLTFESRRRVGEQFQIHRADSGDQCPMCSGHGWVASITPTIEEQEGGSQKVLAARRSYCSEVSGSTGFPFLRTSKCSFGLSASPVDPTNPTIVPADTQSPTLTATR
jgi:hypothetical protein